MGISDDNINFRAPKATFDEIADLMQLWDRDRSWICREAVKVYWTLMFETQRLLQFIEEWQAFRGKTSQRAVARTAITVSKPDGHSFFPRISSFPGKAELS